MLQKMKNLLTAYKSEIFSVNLIVVLILARLLPHPPNFTPIIAIAIMSSYFFRNIYLSLATLLIAMFLSDIFIGFYEHIFFVYIALFLITLTFFKISKKINLKNLFIFSFFGSLVFYLISNFGVWFIGEMYEKNLSGLVYCYFLAIPFFKNTLLSTIIFSYAAFLADNFYKKAVR